VQAVFTALSDGAALNPDPEEDEAGDFVYDEDEVAHGAPSYEQRVLDHLDSVMQGPDGFQEYDDAITFVNLLSFGTSFFIFALFSWQ
jgi:hypothetical protein